VASAVVGRGPDLRRRFLVVAADVDGRHRRCLGVGRQSQIGGTSETRLGRTSEAGIRRAFETGVRRTFETGVRRTFEAGVRRTFETGVRRTFETGVRRTFETGVRRTFETGVRATGAVVGASEYDVSTSFSARFIEPHCGTRRGHGTPKYAARNRSDARILRGSGAHALDASRFYGFQGIG